MIVVTVSWPFQIAYLLWAETPFSYSTCSKFNSCDDAGDHFCLYAYIWTMTQSLAVVTVYHAAFDQIRDEIEVSIGYGSLVEIWQMLTLTILGGLLLWKGNWKHLTARKT